MKIKNDLKRALYLALITLFAANLAGCAQKNVARMQPAKAAPEGTTVLAVYEAWFGEGDHIDVGYSSHDKVVLTKQVEQAQNMGISGFVVDWYGTSKPFIDGSFAAMQQVAADKNFKVALMYDEIEDADSSHMTENAISHLDYAYQNYIGPNAPSRGAYLTYEGRPMIFIWGRGGKTDWQRVSEHVKSWAQPPLLIFKDEPTKYADVFDGRYAWIHAGKGGFKADGSDWGEDYLQNFYSKMVSQDHNKIIVGAAWAGFDDSRASWSENRYMDQRCGKTFEQTLHYPRRYFNASNPLPFLLIATWNDHEEGTGIERGIAKVPPSKNPRSSNCSGD